MANKLITDLQLIAAVTDTCNVPTDDSIQTYRATFAQVFNYLRLKFGTIATTITAAGTTLTSANVCVLLDPTGASFTQALPACASIPTGYQITFKNITTGANTVTLDPSGSEKIDDSSTIDLASMESVTLLNKGTVWYII